MISAVFLCFAVLSLFLAWGADSNVQTKTFTFPEDANIWIIAAILLVVLALALAFLAGRFSV
jgi:hypothetical protein